MEFRLEITEHIYPDTPCAEIGKFFKKDKYYYYQRKSDVLFINTKRFLITSHSIGFLENCDYNECTKKEFSDALNTVIFNLNILNGEFK